MISFRRTLQTKLLNLENNTVKNTFLYKKGIFSCIVYSCNGILGTLLGLSDTLFMKHIKIFLLTVIVVLGLSASSTVFAAGNIDPVQKYSQFLNTNLDSSGGNDFINWNPTNGGATVGNTSVTGNIWGDTVGWINLNPTNAGVTNSCSGILGGYAWGQNTGWINFAPTNATGPNQPKINTTTGVITGTVWSQNYGWIQLSSPDGTYPGLKTSWAGCTTTDVCPNITGLQATIPPGMIIDGSGNCVYPPQNDCTTTGTCPNGGNAPVLRVIKHVVNTGGGTKIASDFTIHVKNSGGNDVIGSPFPGNGTGNLLTPGTGTYVVSEDSVSNYSRSFSGDCNALGQVVIASPITYTCLITNTYVPASQIIKGCTDPNATNYNPLANTDNGTCKYKNTPIYGCTDINAINYNPAAIINDNSCLYKDNHVDPIYICSDGLDNDGDGNVDYPTDPGCVSAYDNTEENPGPIKDPVKDPTSDPINPITTPTSGFPFTNIKSLSAIAKPLAVIITSLGLIATIPGVALRIINIIIAIPFRRKRRPYGVVYDAETKQPLDPVYVTVYDATTNKQIDTKITDIHGRYGFLLPVGTYRMSAQKTHYQFPSQKNAHAQSDGVYDDLYFGDVFSITNENSNMAVTLNIPMDKLENDWNQEEKKRMGLFDWFTRNTKLWATISLILFIVGFAFSVFALTVYPTAWNIIVFILYVIFTILQVLGVRPITTGTVTDRFGKALPHSIVRVWNAHLGTQIAQRVTNDKGQYYLLVAKGEYYLTVDVKNASGGYDRVLTTETMSVKQGIINKDLKIT